MVTLVRPAKLTDASVIARLVDIASEGLASWFWQQIAAPGENALSVGERHSATDESDHSWRKTKICEIAGNVAGGVSAYPAPLATAPGHDEPNPMMRTVRRLEARLPGTRYIYQLAVLPAYRRQGVARALLAEVARDAEGARGLSLIVVDANGPAIALYRSGGFVEVAREPMPTLDGWQTDGKDLVAMFRALPP